ncbi:MAG: alpha-2-macroglobulin family protein [Pseudomonadota bacterium]
MAKGTFPAPAWGSMLLTIFCVGSSGKDPVGLLTDGQNLPVLPNREIRIDLKGAPEKAAPGAKINIKATVMDAAGKKIDAAVGAAIVDEAVISMLDPLEKTPMDKFYNPQLKVLSTTGSKILTWPVVTRNWGYPLYDIALPPFGFRAGGATSQGSSYGYGGGGGYGYGGGGGGGSYGGYDGSGESVDYYMDSGADYAPAGNITKSDEKAPKKKAKMKMKAKKKENVVVKAAQMKLLDSTMLEGSVGGYDYPAASASAPMPAAPMPSPEPAYEESKVAAGKYELAFSDDAVDGELAFYKVGTEKQKQKPKVSITVRTNFAETSLWEPTLEAKNGDLTVSSVLPDSITTQTITLLASDDKGSVGMARHEIEVAQDIYTRSNLPATLTVGDSVEVFAMVKNLTKKKVSCKVSLASEALNVAGVSERDVTVPAGGVGVAGFVVEPKKAGPAMYEVKAEGAKFTDVERRELFVRPLGVPDRIEARGHVKKGKAFKAKVKVSGNDMYLFSFLNVSLPTAVPMIQGMEEILSQPGGAIDFVSSKALTTAMVYQYLVKYAKNEEAIERLNPFLQQLMAAQLMTQNHDGGWGWHFHLLRADVDGTTDVVKIKSNPYMTAQTIEALVEMKRAGLPVPEQAIGRAMQFLASAVSSDNLWSVDDIAFWEGSTKQVQEGISAEIFRVMADACEVYPNLLYSWNMQNPMDKISATFSSYLDMEEMRDPMGLSNAAMGVYTWAKVRGGVGKDLEKKLRAAANKLITARKESYWEPSWFNAFGGTIEATTAAMMFMHKFDEEAYESELRRSIQYILSTQESFGAWHNARGTAAAIRALLLVPPTEKEIASSVKVLVNGNLVEKVDIDPDDPYLSAVSLRQVEITKHLTKGENMIEVTYDGNLKAPVSLMLQKWTGKKAYSAVRQQGAPEVTVARSYKGKGNKQDAPTEVKVSLNVKESRGPLVVREPLPSNAQVEGASLDALLEEGKVEGYEIDGDDIVFYLVPGKKGLMSFSYRVTSVRSGKAYQPGTTISSVHDPDAFVSGQPTEFIVK